jgi:hypothetical protein
MTTTPAMGDGKAMTEDAAVLDVSGRRSKAPGETSRSTEGEPMRLARLLTPEVVNEATKLAGGTGTKGSTDPDVASQLLAKIEEISKIFWETKQG